MPRACYRHHATLCRSGRARPGHHLLAGLKAASRSRGTSMGPRQRSCAPPCACSRLRLFARPWGPCRCPGSPGVGLELGLEHRLDHRPEHRAQGLRLLGGSRRELLMMAAAITAAAGGGVALLPHMAVFQSGAAAARGYRSMAGALRRRRSPPETLPLEGTYTDNLTDPDFQRIWRLNAPEFATSVTF